MPAPPVRVLVVLLACVAIWFVSRNASAALRRRGRTREEALLLGMAASFPVMIATLVLLRLLGV